MSMAFIMLKKARRCDRTGSDKYIEWTLHYRLCGEISKNKKLISLKEDKKKNTKDTGEDE